MLRPMPMFLKGFESLVPLADAQQDFDHNLPVSKVFER